MQNELLAVVEIVFAGVLFNIWFAWAVYFHEGRRATRERYLY